MKKKLCARLPSRVHFTFLAGARKPRPRGRSRAHSVREDAGREQIDHQREMHPPSPEGCVPASLRRIVARNANRNDLRAFPG